MNDTGSPPDGGARLGPKATEDEQPAEVHTRALTLRAKSAQPLDQQGIEGQGILAVDEGVDDLVVPRGRHVELVADGLFLGAGVLPPEALEREDLAVALGQGFGYRKT